MPPASEVLSGKCPPVWPRFPLGGARLPGPPCSGSLAKGSWAPTEGPWIPGEPSLVLAPQRLSEESSLVAGFEGARQLGFPGLALFSVRP